MLKFGFGNNPFLEFIGTRGFLFSVCLFVQYVDLNVSGFGGGVFWNLST